MAESEDVTALLKAARKQIERPESWTQGHYARDASARKVHALDPTATRWCASGALAVVNNGFGAVELDALEMLGRVLENGVYGNRTVADYNDSCTHEEVLALFDDAIALSEASGH